MLDLDENTKNNTSKKTLIFTRTSNPLSYIKSWYPIDILNLVNSQTPTYLISEYNTGDIYIDLKKYSIQSITYQDYQVIYNVINISEVISRCRGLRSISYNESKKLILVCSKFCIELLKNNTFDTLLTLPADNYVMEILIRIAQYYKLKCYGFCNFFIPGYKRLTLFGENNKVRNVSEEEINKIFKYLINKTPSPMAKKRNPHKTILYGIASYTYRILFRYYIKYKLLNLLSYEYKFAKIFIKPSFKTYLFENKYYNELDFSKIPQKSVVINLHFHPEATIDYWCINFNMADYLYSVLEVISFCRKNNYNVYVKEHPAMHLLRDLDFYKKLKTFNNVILLKSSVKTQDLLNHFDKFIVWTGSVGMEALFCGKKVYTVTENYYSNNILPSYDCLIQKYPKITYRDKKHLLTNVLEGLLPHEQNKLIKNL